MYGSAEIVGVASIVAGALVMAPAAMSAEMPVVDCTMPSKSRSQNTTRGDVTASNEPISAVNERTLV